ncbi:MAG: EAL domain-containing protein, partial [Erysipelotrichaceae bacterium]|nr:EAL domain-containing protein [Erysipelotrichaceae bacterium]
MKKSQYTIQEMSDLLKNMSGMYDLARIVDPIECRIINIQNDGTIRMNESCYGIWNAGVKCSNCSSSVACKTRCHQEKDEYFDDKVFHIQSNPVTLKLPDGGVYDAVVELVNIQEDNLQAALANDRAAENIDHNAEQYQVVHDEMTKLLNPGPFYELCRKQIIDTPDKSWMMITGNIMNFKLVNTLFGDQKGNELLVVTAEELKKIADEAGGLCGRIGGDHYALLLPHEDYDEKLLTGIQKDLSGRFNCGIYTYIIHFGVYDVNDSSLPISVMCGRANTALSTIRDDLTQTVAYFDEDMLQKALFEQEVISGFSDALEEKQFQMYLQPLCDKDGKIHGAEALSRWIKPDGSMIMPGDFIEILEQAGLIHELDMYIWEC